MNNNLSLMTLTAGAQELEALLNVELEENGGEITPYVEKLLAAIGLSDEEKTEAIAAKVDGYYALMSQADAESKRYKEMKMNFARTQSRYEKVSQSIKTRLTDIMRIRGIEKLKGEYCTVGWRNCPESVEITDEEALMRPYQKVIDTMMENLPSWVKVEYNIDKKALKEQIQEGYPVSGVEVVRNRNIQIK